MLRPDEEGFRVEREPDGSLRVVGRSAERAVALNDVTTPDAQAFIAGRLSSLGVYRALERAGAVAGDVVHIGGLTFDYEPE